MILDYSTEGLPIILDEASEEIQYKYTKVSFFVLKEAFESDMDKVQITPNLDLTKNNNFVTFGCLTLTKIQVNQLIKIVWKQLKQCKQHGN